MRDRLILLGLILTTALTAEGADSLRAARFEVTTQEAACQWQQASRSKLFALMMGGAKPKACPLQPQVLQRVEAPDGKCMLEELSLQSLPDRRVHAWLAVPANLKGRTGAVLALHGHGGSGREVVNGASHYWYGRAIVDMGCVVIAPDIGSHTLQHSNWTLMGERVWDALRCLDYLETRPEVDKARLAVAGLSLGGETTMYVAALDERIKAACSSGWLTTIANLKQGHCPCWNFPGLEQTFEFADIFACVAPRPLVCEIGEQEKAPGGFPVPIARKAFEQILPAYRVFGAETNLVLDVHPGGHVFHGVLFWEPLRRALRLPAAGILQTTGGASSGLHTPPDRPLPASAPPGSAGTRTRLISLFKLAPGNSEKCVRWAAGDVTNALAAAGVASRSANIRVAVVPGQLPAEGFELAIRGPMVSVKGGDAVGLMYGLFELSEQIANAGARRDWHTLAAELRGTRQQPFLEFRGNNAFVHTAPGGRLFDVPMWEAYIDMLARCRFNVLDLHGLYDERTTDFPSIYPLLLTLADYPGVGDRELQAQNLADFKAILAHARQRGVKVAFMNYIVSTPGVAADRLADYTAKAVAKLLQEVPDLYMLGFRIGETGQKESFFRDAYLQGVKESGRDVRLYTRSWLAKQPQLEEIARASSGGLDIEIKYNGEQLGLPYQAIQRVSPLEEPSYSYENYLDVPAPYRIIWQVRANGTHRFWAWEQTGFIRRTVRTFTFGNARGFTLEPHIAYFPFAAASYYQQPADQQVYRWIWQKHWMWYLAWGRLAYNPALPESTIVSAFERRFGPPGREIYQAMQDSGTIVPLALAYRHQGPDHRDHSPETETGTGQGMYRLSGKQEPIPLLKFARNLPLDSRSFVGVTPFAEEQLAGQADGRIGPSQVARLLSDAALKTREDVARVSGLSGHAADEWRLLKTDVLCAAALGDYYASRILGMTHLVYALEADSLADYQQATNFLDQSRTDWRRLAETADPVFAPLSNPLRHQLNFKWTSQLSVLEALDATAPKIWEQRKPATTNAPPLRFRPVPGPNDILATHLRHDILGHTVRVSCSVTATNGVKQVLLWSKPLPSTESWRSSPMVADGNEYSLTVPLTPHGLLYQVEVRDQTGGAAIFPQVLEETPYRAITPAEMR